MASLVDSIKLELVADELSANEWSQFLSKMGKAFILNSIKSTKSKEIHQAISAMKQIIQSRDEALSDTPSQVECIDQLSSGLIGEIASYLHVGEYGRFEQCNRTLYVASNSPNKVQKIKLPAHYSPANFGLDKSNEFYSSLNIYKYSTARTLTCDMCIDILRLGMSSTMYSVTELSFGCRYLSLSRLIEFTSKFPSTKILKFSGRWSGHETDLDPKMMKLLPPNVKELGLCHHKSMQNILKFYGSQIEKLSLDDVGCLNVIGNGLNLAELLHLTVQSGLIDSNGSFEWILCNAPKLKKVEVWCRNKEADDFEFFCNAFVSALAHSSIAVKKFSIDIFLSSRTMKCNQSRHAFLTVFEEGITKISNSLPTEDIHFYIVLNHCMWGGIPFITERIRSILKKKSPKITVQYNGQIM